MSSRKLSRYGGIFLLSLSSAFASASAPEDGRKLSPLFEQQVTRRLSVPPDEQERYAELLTSALDDAGLSTLSPQYMLVVDRSPYIQAAMIEWKGPDGLVHLIGATPVSTGRPGTYEHFITPLGVHEHRTNTPDFRSEGTRNKFGIRGYGVKGLRIFDFGWVKAPKSWGDHAVSRLRLQVHATDPTRLDPRLGTVQSEGCVRTTASFNTFLDRYGILDGDYEQAAAEGHKSWVLSATRERTPWSGRYLVVVDSPRERRPLWAKPSPTMRKTER
jgi:hypothetical protein